MKFVHLGDLHLGKTLGDFDLIPDQQFILKEIIGIIQEKQADAVLIAGDVYDKALPSEAATNLLDWFLSSLSELGVMTFVISGNHDSDDRLNYGSRLFESNRVYIAAKYDGILFKKTVRDEYGEADIYLMPFVKASEVRHYFPEAKIDTYDDAVRVILEQAKIDPERRNVIAAHQFVTGAVNRGCVDEEKPDPVTAGSESIGTKTVGLVEKIGCDCFDEFDYAALGHIHSPQRVGREEVRYAGSPLKYSLGEAGNRKSVPVVTLKEKGKVEIELVPLKPERDLRHMKGKLAELLDHKKVQDPNDFIYATLTDEEIVDDVMALFRQEYPNTVRIDYDNSHTKAVEQFDFSNIAGERSFDELIGDFYRMMYGTEITEEEMMYMRTVAGEAGILHETD